MKNYSSARINRFTIISLVSVSMLFSTKYFIELQFNSLIIKNMLMVFGLSIVYFFVKKQRIECLRLVVNICLIYFGLSILGLIYSYQLPVLISVLGYFLWVLFAYVIVLNIFLRMRLNDLYFLADKLIRYSLFTIFLMSVFVVFEGGQLYTHNGRLSGPFTNPLNFAAFLFFLYSLLFLFSNNYKKSTFAILSILLLLLLSLTSSRTYIYPAILLFISDYIFLRFKLMNFYYYEIFVVLFFLVLTFTIVLLIYNDSIYDSINHLLSGRLNVWRGALYAFMNQDMLLSVILFGGVSAVNPDYIQRISFDSTLIEIYATTGLVGLLLYLFLSIKTVLFLHRNIVRFQPNSARALMVFVSIFITGITYSGSAYIANIVSLFIIPLSIAISGRQISSQHQRL
jgi:hypothetical protein